MDDIAGLLEQNLCGFLNNQCCEPLSRLEFGTKP
jgi:hypothetical protein